MFEENVFIVNLDAKLHKALFTSLFLSIIKNHDKVELDFKRKIEEAKIDEENKRKKEAQRVRNLEIE
jgi:hypothetical protein